MKTFCFEGYSDDTFGEYGSTKEDWDNCANGHPFVVSVWSASEKTGLYVWGWYAGKQWPKEAPGCWMIGVQQWDEDIALPRWNIRYSNGESGYTPSLLLDVPDDTKIERLKERR